MGGDTILTEWKSRQFDTTWNFSVLSMILRTDEPKPLGTGYQIVSHAFSRPILHIICVRISPNLVDFFTGSVNCVLSITAHHTLKHNKKLDVIELAGVAEDLSPLIESDNPLIRQVPQMEWTHVVDISDIDYSVYEEH